MSKVANISENFLKRAKPFWACINVLSLETFKKIYSELFAIMEQLMKGLGLQEKKIHLGDMGDVSRWMEIDITPSTKSFKGRGGRKKKLYETSANQQRVNTKRATRYLNQIAKCNFTEADYFMTLTFSQKFKPATIEEAERQLDNYLARVRRKRKAAGLNETAYICVTETGEFNNNIHFHLLISGGLDSTEMKMLWCDRKRRGIANRELLGFARCDNIDFEDKGMDDLIRYMAKRFADAQAEQEGQLTLDDLIGERQKGKRRWKQSRGLKRPWFERPTMNKYKRKEVRQIVEKLKRGELGSVKAYFEARYEHYIFDSIEYTRNDYIDEYSLYVKMHYGGVINVSG